MTNKMKLPKTVVSDFVCTECRPWAFPLRVRRPRKDGHIKDIYCYCAYCGKVTKHTEVEGDDDQ